MNKLIKSFIVLVVVLMTLSCERQLNSTITNSIKVRFYNNSAVELCNVKIEDVSFANISPFSYTDYQDVVNANEFSPVYLEIDGQSVWWVPNDYEVDPFKNGHYLYVISVHQQSKQLYVAYFENDKLPSYNQPDSGSLLLNRWAQYAIPSLAHSGPNSINLIGTKEIRSFYNPTLATTPESKLIYLPDALVVTHEYESVLCEMDLFGESFSTEYVWPGRVSGHQMKKILSTPENILLIAGSDYIRSDSGYHQNQGESIWWQVIHPDGFSTFQNQMGEHITGSPTFGDICIAAPNRFLIAGGVEDKGYIAIVDSRSEILNEIVLDDVGNIRSISQCASGSYVVVTFGAIAKLDANFEVEWSLQVDHPQKVMSNNKDSFYLLAESSISKRSRYDGSIQTSFSLKEHFDKALWMCQADSGNLVISGKDANRNYLSMMMNEHGQIIWQHSFDIPVYFDDRMGNPLIRVENSTFHIIDSFNIWFIEISLDGRVNQKKKIIGSVAEQSKYPFARTWP